MGNPKKEQISIDQKKEIALTLYLQGYLKKDIAAKAKITQTTLRRWIEEHDWKIIKAAESSTKPKLISNLYAQSLKVIEKAENEKRPLTPAESDQLLKISKTIEQLRGSLSLETYIQVFKEYNQYLSKDSPKLLKPNNLAQMGFIQIKIDEFKTK